MKEFREELSIGVVALSTPSNKVRNNKIASAINLLQSNGFKIVVGKTVFAELGYKSATISDRLDDLHRMFQNPEVNLILNTTGGYNSNELLEFLDFSLIANSPKWFVGYSDITALLLGIYSQTGLTTVNGPMLVDLSEDPECLQRLFSVLIDDNRSELNNCETFWEADCVESKTAELKLLNNKKNHARGKILVGNLSTFNLILGTRYFPDTKNSILFLEYDKEESKALPSMERYLWQLRQAGVFDRISALVFGLLQKEVQAEESEFQNVEKILTNVTDGYRFPVLFNAQFGHILPSWILKNGEEVEIEKTQIRIKSRQDLKATINVRRQLADKRYGK